MDTLASPPADGLDRRSVLAALERQIKNLRREFSETCELIGRLRASYTKIEAKLEATEAHHAMLLEDAERP